MSASPLPALILASASPRRQHLLGEAGYTFAVRPATVHERHVDFLTPRELTVLNARRKALAVARAHRDELVLGADTLVAVGSETLGKPSSRAEAVEMLSRLSGRSHEVYSTVCLAHWGRGRAVTFTERSTVYFRPLTPAQIKAYLSRVNPLDKAGAYAAQEGGEEIIERVEGSWTNVVGLPMEGLPEAIAMLIAG